MTTTPPETLKTLLNELGVPSAEPDVQDAALRAWLRTNQPGPHLAEQIASRDPYHRDPNHPRNQKIFGSDTTDLGW